MGSIYCTPRIWWDFLGFVKRQPHTMRLVVAVQTTQRRVSNVPSLGSSPLKDVLDSYTQFVIKVALA